MEMKAVLIQHFRFDTDTDIFIVILINKFYPTDIIKLTKAFLLTDIND